MGRSAAAPASATELHRFRRLRPAAGRRGCPGSPGCPRRATIPLARAARLRFASTPPPCAPSGSTCSPMPPPGPRTRDNGEPRTRTPRLARPEPGVRRAPDHRDLRLGLARAHIRTRHCRPGRRASRSTGEPATPIGRRPPTNARLRRRLPAGARQAVLSHSQQDVLDAANLLVVAYSARCQHSDQLLRPDLGDNATGPRLLRERGDLLRHSHVIPGDDGRPRRRLHATGRRKRPRIPPDASALVRPGRERGGTLLRSALAT